MRTGRIVLAVAMVWGIVSVATAAELVLEWKFDGNLNDTSGSGIHASPYPNAGAIQYDTGVSGQAFVSDGSQCALKTGIDIDALPFRGEDAWSVNVWVYPTVIPQDWRLVWCLGQKPSGAANSRSLYSSASAYGGQLTFVGYTPTSQSWLVSHVPWDINQWQMVTTTYDGSVARMYKNGVLIAMRSYVFQDAPGEIRIPSNPWSGSDFFIGKFDEFTIWRGALSSEQIRDMIIPGVLPEIDYEEQAVYLKMDDPDSSTMTLPDHSGKNNHATMAGFSSPLDQWIGHGFRGGALVFDGENRRVNFPSWTTGFDAVGRGPNHTISFWFKSGLQQWNSAFYCEYDDIDNYHPWNWYSRLIIRTDNELIQAYNTDRDGNMLYNISGDGTDYLDGQTWHHFALVADGEAAEARIYINGQLFAYDDEYVRHSQKTPFSISNISYNDHHPGYLGLWGDTYVDEVKHYRYALTEEEVRALASKSNFFNNLKVDLEDYAFFAEQWMVDVSETSEELVLLDGMEDGVDSWHVHQSQTYSGTGTIEPTTHAHNGDFALRWEYELPIRSGDNYSTIVYSFDATTDISSYDAMTLWLYRHVGNTSESVLFVKFVDDSPTPAVKAEAWLQGSSATVEPVDEWSQWTINLNSLRGPGGSGSADQSDLTAIRYIQIGCGSWTQSTAGSGTIDIDQIEFYRELRCLTRADADLNFDCVVDIDDLVIFAQDWLIGTK